jgi:hypothetical protein
MLPHVRGNGEDRMTETYETIMERVPKVTWTPVPGPDHHDLALRDEMLDQKLRTAARWVYTIILEPFANNEPLIPSEAWTASEVDNLRAILRHAGPLPVGRYFEVREYVIANLGIRQSYASSSRHAEQQTDARAEEDAALAEWVGASAGQG